MHVIGLVFNKTESDSYFILWAALLLFTSCYTNTSQLGVAREHGVGDVSITQVIVALLKNIRGARLK